MNCLAGIYYKQSKYDLAQPLLKECLELGEELFGKDHYSYKLIEDIYEIVLQNNKQ